MTTQVLPKAISRHECMSKNTDATWRHTSGAGVPKRKRCAYCGGSLYVLRGWYGVFVHSSVSGDARYHVTSAQSLHVSEGKAQSVIDADTTGALVIRWVSA